MVPALRPTGWPAVTIDAILDTLIDALIFECHGVPPDGLKRNQRFQRISEICGDLGYVVSMYPAGGVFVIEISQAPNGGLIAPVDVLRVTLKRVPP